MDVARLLLGDLHAVLSSPSAEIVIVAVSIACGAILGAERERRHKTAGLRTLTLICGGSALFTLVSRSPAMGANDASRIAAQIVTGVGFLGAGAIIREKGVITGLTTAATIWVTAAVGMVVGAGYAGAGLLLAVLVPLTLAVLLRAEERFVRCALVPVRVVYRNDQGRTRQRIQGVIDENRAPFSLAQEAALSPDQSELTLLYCPAHKEHRALVIDLAGLQGVERIDPGGGGGGAPPG